MRASCSIIIPGRVTSTSATSAIGASTRIAAMRRRHGLPRRPAGFSAGGAPELSVSGRSRMARSAGWSRLCGVLCQRRVSGPRRPSASGRTRSRAFAAAHTGWPPLSARAARSPSRRAPSAHRTRVAVAMRRSLGFVCCHTAINMLSWLLYPQSVYDRHISRRDCWPPASTSRSAGTPDSTAATCCRPPKGSFEIFNRVGEPK